jgi:protein phosphatase 1 regulatory subunit 11
VRGLFLVLELSNIHILISVCCIYHKPRRFDESSSEEDSDDDESSSDDDGRARPSHLNRRHHHRHSHDHEHDGECGTARGSNGGPSIETLESDGDDCNAYERQPSSGKGKAKA